MCVTPNLVWSFLSLSGLRKRPADYFVKVKHDLIKAGLLPDLNGNVKSHLGEESHELAKKRCIITCLFIGVVI